MNSTPSHVRCSAWIDAEVLARVAKLAKEKEWSISKTLSRLVVEGLRRFGK